MLKKRIIAVALCFLLALGSIPVMPMLQETIEVKAEERKNGKQSPGLLDLSVDSNVDFNEIIDEDIKDLIDNNNENSRDGRLNKNFSLPQDRAVQSVNPKLSLDEAKEMLVKDKYDLNKGRITREEIEVPSAFPFEYSKTDDLKYYFETKLPPLRDQGNTGTCWAHSTLGVIETYLLNNEGSNDLHGNISRNVNGNIPGINYSELQLAYFNYHNTVNPLINNQNSDRINTNFTDDSFYGVGGQAYFGVKTLIFPLNKR